MVLESGHQLHVESGQKDLFDEQYNYQVPHTLSAKVAEQSDDTHQLREKARLGARSRERESG
jgi:hypothetical protein